MVGRSGHAEHVCSLNLTFISNSFWNKGQKVLKCWKFDEKRNVKFKLQKCATCQDLPTCNFEVNSITYFGVITLFSSNFQHFNTHVCSLNLTFISNSFWNKGQKVLKCWKFDEKREITPKWDTGFTSKLHGRQILTCWTCLQLNLT
jgi:hypothetical protein